MSTAETWARRVEAWRASGERAEEFSRRDGYAASTLRWWGSKLRREPVPSPPETRREVRIARVVRDAAPIAPAASPRDPAIVVEAMHVGVRISVTAGADRATLTMVFDVLGVGAAR